MNRGASKSLPVRTLSGIPLETHYGAPAPEEFPYTRGVHPGMCRSRRWTMRQFAAFATPEEFLQQGRSGLSVAFDLPTLMGCDPNDPSALGEVGKCGVSIASLAGMDTLFDGIQPDQFSVSMKTNSPALVLFAMYLAVAEEQGVSYKQLNGTLQNDILKEYIAQKE